MSEVRDLNRFHGKDQERNRHSSNFRLPLSGSHVDTEEGENSRYEIATGDGRIIR